MENVSIDKLTDEAFEVTLSKPYTLALGNNYTLEHFIRELKNTLGENAKELGDLLRTLDAPAHSEIVFTYRGLFGFHSDSLDLEEAYRLLTKTYKET